MEVKIGVTNVAREITVEPEITPVQVEKAVAEALKTGGALRLEDARGRVVLVPAASIGYVDIGETSKGRVGFGT